MALIFPKTVFRLRLQLAGQYRPTMDPNVNLSPSPLVTVTGTTVVTRRCCCCCDAAALLLRMLRTQVFLRGKRTRIRLKETHQRRRTADPVSLRTGGRDSCGQLWTGHVHQLIFVKSDRQVLLAKQIMIQLLLIFFCGSISDNPNPG